MDLNDAKTHNHKLVPHKGYKLINGTHDSDDVDQIYNLEIRETDVFVVTYPKSGEKEIKMGEIHTHRRHQRPVLRSKSNIARISFRYLASLSQSNGGQRTVLVISVANRQVYWQHSGIFYKLRTTYNI